MSALTRLQLPPAHSLWIQSVDITGAEKKLSQKPAAFK